MIASELARALRDSGLVWRPEAGDAFLIDSVEVDADVFYLSELTVEAHDYPTGTVLGFNGTTEWALDSVALEDALWLPHEEQLRERLGSTFVSLRPGWTVTVVIDGEEQTFEADAAADAYARALIHLLDSFDAE
jgi:hypothetical protein